MQKNLNFEQECKNPKSTVADRAIARIATHPQFNKKIQDIKAAVAVFEEDRKWGGKEKEKNKAGKVTVQSDKKNKTKSDNQKHVVKKQKSLAVEGEESVFQRIVDVTEPNKELSTVNESAERTVANNNKRKTPQTKTAAVAKNTEVKDVKNALKMKEKPESAPESEEESDLDSSDDDDEEKEYFDDSTEERFHKQSSHSEESEEDDFFVGKVSKFKKKKQKDVEMAKANGDQTEEDRSRREKVTSLDSIFCSSLARSKTGRGRGAGRGQTGDGRGGRGRGDSRGRDGPGGALGKRSNFQEKPSHGDRGRGRGRGGVARKTDHRDESVFSAMPALHPSWEASKKRKEQQGQILAFQGKKIKFDDDD